MTTQYKKFTRLLAKWPLDTTKGDRLVLNLVMKNSKLITFYYNKYKF